MLFSLLASTAFAQNDEQDSGGNIFELSPFEVDSSENEGYLATNTLAGTRLRSSLKDVAAPISVFTADLMEDIGADNMQEALLYAVNTENENEYAPDDTEGLSIGNATQSRIRGISSSASQSRGYFKTQFRGDTYNTESFTIARGPNSVLFGLGSPSGVIESTLSRAYLDKSFGKLSFKVDSEEGHRQTFDYNLNVVEDLLAVRVALMNQDRRSYRDPEYDKEERIFVTATIKPFEGTTIRGSWEKMDNDRVRGRSTLSNDHVSDWMAAGSPIFNNGPDNNDPNYQLWSWDGGQTWRMPDANDPSEAWLISNTGSGSGKRHYFNGHLGGQSVQATGLAGTRTTENKTPGYVTRTFSDGSILPTDFNIRGLASNTELEGNISTLVLEQRITKDLYLELAYNEENWKRNSDDPLRANAGLFADINYYIPGTDTMSPNLGRYYVQSGDYLGWIQDYTYESRRATLSYQLDLTETNKWLGSHSFGLLYQQDDYDELQIKTRLRNLGEYASNPLNGNPYGNLTNGDNNIQVRYYLDVPSLGGDPNGLKYPGEWQLPPWPSYAGGVQGDGRPSHSLQELEAKMFVMQNRFFSGKLVTTFGYRQDSEAIFTANTSQRDPVTKEFIYKDVPFNSEPSSDETGITRTYGVVYHTPVDGVSLVYNRSNTFKPQGLLLTWFETPFGSSKGEGEDFGINLDLMDGKLGARITKYENSSENNVETGWFYEEPKWSVIYWMEDRIKRYAEVVNPLLGIDSTADVNFPTVNDQKRVNRDFVAKGYELELYAKPIDNLDIRLTVAQTETINSNINSNLFDYVESRLPVWEKYYGLPDGIKVRRNINDQIAANAGDPNFVPDPLQFELADSNGNVVNAATPTTDYLNTPDTMGHTLYTNSAKYPRLEAIKAQNGLKSDLLREWRVNLIANYKITDGRFAGTTVGGAYRWRSKAAVAYGGMDNPLGAQFGQVEDVNEPLWGPSQSSLDLWASHSFEVKIAGKDCNLKIQLNIQNLLTSKGKLQVTSYDLSGEPTEYSMKAPRVFSLTGTLKF